MTFSRVLAVSLLATAAGTGCGPSIRLPVLQPALIGIPAEIQTVAVIDRSKPKNAGQSVLGALEGALTGESLQADNEGRAQAINGALMVMQNSPRFEVITPTVTKKEVASDIFDKPWTHQGVKRLCKKHGCDGVIALEAFDTDSFTESGAYNTDDSKYNAESSTHWASRRTRIMSSWRFYDASADRHLDQLRDHESTQTWRQESTSIQGAMNSLPVQTETIRRVGYKSGEGYARRISPSWVTVTRSYFGGGSPEMKQAKNHVKAGDWEGARPLWREVVNGTDDMKLKGKAQFNLAVAAEVAGELNKAHKLAKKAAVNLANGKARNYAATLAARKRAQEKLEEQLTPPEESAPRTPEKSSGGDSGGSTGGTDLKR